MLARRLQALPPIVPARALVVWCARTELGVLMAAGVEDGGLDHLVAAATLLGLQIRPEWQDGVRANLRVALTLGAQVAAFPLPDEAEPAPVFAA